MVTLWNVSLSRILLSRIIRYLELNFWPLESISVAISNFSEDAAHKNPLMKVIFVCLNVAWVNSWRLTFDQSKLA